MDAHILIDVIVALVIIAGLVGAVVQVYPGLLLVGGAIAVWGLLTRGAVGWTMVALALVIVLAGMFVKFLIAGRYLSREGVPNGSLLIGGLLGIAGFFVIPVIGLFVGFIGGIYLAEWQRLRDLQAAKDATIVALKATGISILIELAAALLLTLMWIVALFVH